MNTNPPSSGPAKRLGILFVHGIGTQRRGETLAQWGASLRQSLRFQTDSPFAATRLKVDVFETSLSATDSSAPPRTHFAFHQAGQGDDVEWIVAESFWAESFPPPSNREFVQWALMIVPVAIMLHVAQNFRRPWALYKRLRDASNAELDPDRLDRDLRRALGQYWAFTLDYSKPLQDQLITRLLARSFANAFRFLCLLAIGIPLQILLLATIVIRALPIGFLHRFTAWIQKTLTASIGDSYVFVVSPIRASAIVSQVQRDLKWLAESAGCERIAVVAHSQGAAISYRAITQFLDRHHRLPSKLELLITYGSGLRKLFDLETSIEDKRFWKRLGVFRTILTAGVIGFLLSLPWGFLPVAVFPVAGFVLFTMASVTLIGASQLTSSHPIGLPLTWHDLYASHDPVPNGPVDIDSDDEKEKDTFYGRQDEVTIAQSAFVDHTSYWSSTEDFVARVATLLAEWSNLPHGTLTDRRWLQTAVLRRRWRAALRSECRATARLSAILALVWMSRVPSVAVDIARPVRQAARTWLISNQMNWHLPIWVPEVIRRFLDSGVTIGAAVMIGAIYGTLSIALIGWQLWQSREIQSFNERRPYTTASWAFVVFALGWSGIIAVPVALSAGLGSQSATNLAVWWLPLLAGVSTAWRIRQLRTPPGTESDWTAALLLRGRSLTVEFESTTDTGDRYRILREMRGCFIALSRLLDQQGKSTRAQNTREGIDDLNLGWSRVLLGRAHLLAGKFSSELDLEQKNVLGQSALTYLKLATVSLNVIPDSPEKRMLVDEAVALRVGWFDQWLGHTRSLLLNLEPVDDLTSRLRSRRDVRANIAFAGAFLWKRGSPQPQIMAARARAIEMLHH